MRHGLEEGLLNNFVRPKFNNSIGRNNSRSIGWENDQNLIMGKGLNNLVTK